MILLFTAAFLSPILALQQKPLSTNTLSTQVLALQTQLSTRLSHHHTLISNHLLNATLTLYSLSTTLSTYTTSFSTLQSILTHLDEKDIATEMQALESLINSGDELQMKKLFQEVKKEVRKLSGIAVITQDMKRSITEVEHHLRDMQAEMKDMEDFMSEMEGRVSALRSKLDVRVKRKPGIAENLGVTKAAKKGGEIEVDEGRGRSKEAIIDVYGKPLIPIHGK